MPGILKVKILEGHDLPIMDRASDLTDAFVEVRFGNATYKTEVFRKSLNPRWDSEWFKFEVDDEDLQEECLQIKVLDYDVYSAHDAIGKISIALDILVTKDGCNELNGWFPIYDTLHGIRGYLRLKVRVQFFIDANKYRQTSCGVPVFGMSCIPQNFHVVAVQGLVDELLVENDPEYQWIEKIRTPRASNEARQLAFTKLAGEVKRKVGVKVLEAGGNALVGYQQYFDLEGETGLVVRAIGTSVTMVKDSSAGSIVLPLSSGNSPALHNGNTDIFVPEVVKLERGISQLPDIPPSPNVAIPLTQSQKHAHYMTRTLSVSSETQEFFENGVDGCEGAKVMAIYQRARASFDELDIPLFTLTVPPYGFLHNLGGLVSSRSVKLLGKIKDPEEPETRDSWWNELRMEIRSHAKAMGCTAVIGYSEYTTICDDLIVLTGYGTACVVNVYDASKETCVTDGNNENHFDLDCTIDSEGGYLESPPPKAVKEVDDDGDTVPVGNPALLSSCNVCHVPYSDVDVALPVMLGKCMFCRNGKVPDVLFTTIEPPEDIPITGSGCMIQSRVIRTKKKEKDETNAENVSQILPFMEYDLHQQLMNKLKIKGMNAIFGIKTRLSIGEQAMVGVMTGTAVYLTALPPPAMLLLSDRKDSRSDLTPERTLMGMQRRLIDITQKNITFHNLKDPMDIPESPLDKIEVAEYPLEAKTNQLDLLNNVKEAYVLEIEDKTDEEALPLLLDNGPQEGFYIFNTQQTPGYPVLKQDNQFISVFQRAKMNLYLDDDNKNSTWLLNLFDNLLLGLRLKLRSFVPCCITNISYDIDIDDDDYFQVTVSGSCVGVDEKATAKVQRRTTRRSFSSQSDKGSHPAEDLQFAVDFHDGGKRLSETRPIEHTQSGPASSHRGSKNSRQSSLAPNFQPPVTVTPMGAIPNYQVATYLGYVNLFLIRESSAVKEDGGLDLFMQQFISEVQAILRSHVVALGGNALLSFCLNEVILTFNPHKYQAQCLINVSGDAAEVRLCELIANGKHTGHIRLHSSSSLESSPVATQQPEIIEEIKYKLDRGIYGTNV